MGLPYLALLLLTAPLLVVTDTESDFKDFKCPAALALFPSQQDCSKYFQCQDGKGFVADCGEGQLFDAPSKKCVGGKDALCQNAIDPTFKCPAALGIFPHQQDCKRFIQCREDVGFVSVCGEGQLFDAILKICIDENSARCGGILDEDYKCPAALGIFPHREDCSQYYKCYENIGFILICGAGLHFDAPSKTCLDINLAVCETQDEKPIVCPEWSGIFPHPFSRKKYMHCEGNFPNIMTCPEVLVFDSNLRICSWV